MTEPTREQLIEACRQELWHLWHDLPGAFQTAIRCTWSINAVDIKERIQALTKLVGPTYWDEVNISLIEAGVYREVHAEIGVEVSPDMERVAQVRASIEARNGRL